MHFLTQHSVEDNSGPSVAVDMRFTDCLVEINFSVNALQYYTKDSFNPVSWDNWGLWEYDVVEVFIKRGKSSSDYLELQVSPLGQKLALLIHKPRVELEKVVPSLTAVKVNFDSKTFKASFMINASDIPGEGNEIWGNLHSILGPTGNQSFYSLHPGPGKPDFHRPEYFQKWGVLCLEN